MLKGMNGSVKDVYRTRKCSGFFSNKGAAHRSQSKTLLRTSLPLATSFP